jgi:hypothetical protein
MTIRSAQRALTVTLAVLCLVGLAEPAIAKPKPAAAAPAPTPAKKKPVALAAFEGKKNAEVRGWVREVVATNFELTDAEDFKVKSDPAAVVDMGKNLGVEGVILGKLEKKSLKISAYDAADGRLLAVIEIKQPPGPKLKNVISKKLGPRLLAAYGIQSPEEVAKQQAQAKQEAEEAGAQEEGEGAEEGEKTEGAEEETAAVAAAEEGASEGGAESEEAAAATPSGPTPSPFEARAGFGLSKRDFTFHDTLNEFATPQRPLVRPLRDYEGGLDISVWLRADVYPAAFFGGQGLISNIGLTIGAELGIPSSPVYVNSAGQSLTLKTNAQEYYLGARLRVPVTPTAGLVFVTSYGQQKYILKNDESFALVPDVAYDYLRLAAEGNLRFGKKITAEAALGVRLILGTGELERPDIWFRNVGGIGSDLSLNVAYEILPLLSAFAGFRYTRYDFDFNPIVEDDVWLRAGAIVAGGAVDQYLGGLVGVIFRLPGKPGTP